MTSKEQSGSLRENSAGSERYTFGEKQVPLWAEKRLMCFKTAEGGVGWEVDTGSGVSRVYSGDVLVRKGIYIYIERKRGR